MNSPRAAVLPGWHCAACGGQVRKDDRVCSHCGARLVQPAPWHEQPVWIAVLILTLLGALGIPLIWRSRQLSRPAKWLFTLATILYTLIIILLLVWISILLWEHLQAFQMQMDDLGM